VRAYDGYARAGVDNGGHWLVCDVDVYAEGNIFRVGVYCQISGDGTLACINNAFSGLVPLCDSRNRHGDFGLHLSMLLGWLQVDYVALAHQ
jgi:hypothetical protein